MRYCKHTLALLSLVILGVSSALAGNSIRIQGRLTDSNGAPIIGNDARIKVSFFSAPTGGNLILNVPGDTDLPTNEMRVITNDSGLFARDMSPVSSSIFAANPDIYLEIQVRTTAGFRTLLPRQKLSTVPFAMRAEGAAVSDLTLAVSNNSIGTNQIIDQSISSSDIAAGAIDSVTILDGSVQMIDLAPEVKAMAVPSGLIAMFARDCPAGWTRFAELDNRFPMGVVTYTGTGGGSPTITGLTTSPAGGHSHTVNAHTHGVGTLTVGAGSGLQLGKNASEGHFSPENHTHSLSGATATSSPGTDTQGTHSHTISSDGSWLPPYLGVNFCEKN